MARPADCRGCGGPGEEVAQFGVGVVFLLRVGDDACGLEEDAAVFVDSHEEASAGVAGEDSAAACIGFDEC
ncbi:hypothetical protein BEL07_22840 [Mycolicibacterium grossiae]|uniref:Uncharacterized protein n=1 Tax=Mycolicibacterium grossiae TaxID=1552759 RepID=A0A1E8PYL5_9MYCO|nr:hypothetical protein BEL07_22840 [Mycolicibacterium grossiae]